MAAIHPFDGYLASPGRVVEVASPAYDAMSPAERHAYVQAHPRNFLAVMRSPDEFPPEERPDFEALLAWERRRLEAMIEAGDFVRADAPSLYLYRLAVDGHEQTGVVGELPVAEYEQGLVKKHEHTQKSKEDELARYLEVVRASSSPMGLAHADHAGIEELVAELCERPPALDFVAEDGLAQTVWAVTEAEAIARLQALFAEVPVTYLTDGHHRAASASRFAARARAANPAHTGREPYNFMLVALYPARRLRILAYNRCVRDAARAGIDGLAGRLQAAFSVEPLEVGDPEAALPRRRHQMTMLADGSRFRLTVRPELVPGDPVGRLDVSLLQAHALGPVFEVEDPRTDPRLVYVSGACGFAGLERFCREEGAVGFALYPTAIEDLMAVADAGLVMPPKSTWFDPKLRSGVFLRLR